MDWRSREFRNSPAGALTRALYKGMGYSDNDLKKPIIAVANSWNTVCPGQFNLNQVAQAVREGINEAGGMPVEFGTIGPCDGIAQGHNGMKFILPCRDVIASSVELMIEAHQIDGMVLLGSCDKIVPGMLMAAARLNLPTIIVTGGPMETGRYKGQNVDVNTIEVATGAFKAGRITEEEFKEIENSVCPGPGSCQMMGTANTMCCLTEAIGLSLPGSAAVPAVAAKRLVIARESGRQIISLVEKGITAGQIITKESIENAIKVGLAIGGSTNLVLHILALAHEAGIQLDIEEFDSLSLKTPYIASLVTASKYDMVDFFRVGGIPVVMKELMPLLNKHCVTVTGHSLETNINILNPPDPDGKVIRSLENPFKPTGGLAVLKGNLAPGTAIAKPAAIPEDRLVCSGPAKVFDAEEDLIAAIHDGKIKPGDIIVVRYEGPKGGPGMREMYTPLKLLDGYELAESVFLITDGRFSGSNKGGFIGHICPEAAEGGPIALVKDGDIISIDINRRNITLEVPDDEIEIRRAGWTKKEPKVKKGYLALYAKIVSSANKGAILSSAE
ncbi:dihydroxy-acid dehydratase [Desulfitibacter alkalitolerans]|uniref:dihydroxy-acid dehydratase n=1 Tax=Desulfitibacter alkalitolerans TaxID=264641 RepID=UPI0004812AEA|nr:dihydroxy-acid dehydratase [Desulfitibacter alkalitolerans]